jgi:predicted  nucleic acid-binding Zn-ribbon protein
MNYFSFLSDENFLDIAKNKVKTDFERELLERIYTFKDSFDVLWEESYNKEQELNSEIEEKDDEIAELKKEIISLETEISTLRDDLLYQGI